MASLDELKKKYQSVIDFAKERGVHLKNVHVENDKLLIRGDAPNAAIKNEVWDQIKKVDAKYPDLTADIGVDSALPVPPKIHVVAAGETLSAIATAYRTTVSAILQLNRLPDANSIRVGQKLMIPESPPRGP